MYDEENALELFYERREDADAETADSDFEADREDEFLNEKQP